MTEGVNYDLKKVRYFKTANPINHVTSISSIRFKTRTFEQINIELFELS